MNYKIYPCHFETLFYLSFFLETSKWEFYLFLNLKELKK